jgi:hypothetical protein
MVFNDVPIAAPRSQVPNHRSMASFQQSRALKLACTAAAALYFELALIRFTAAEVLYLGYFSNFVLITAFVGLGIGFLCARRNLELDDLIPLLLVFVVALVLVSKFDVNVLRNHFGLFFFGNVTGRAGVPGALLMAVLFLAIAALFAALGARIGRAFLAFAPLSAYTWDIAGSLFGVLLFTAQSLVACGPVTWLITGGLLLALGCLIAPDDNAGRVTARVLLGMAGAVLLVLSAADGAPTVWSTYQKLTLRTESGSGLKIVYANGIVHQFMHPLATARDSYYGLPYRLAAEHGVTPGRVLIVGAGTGTDVAVALDAGAAEVDAVEIDGRIAEWGRLHHPDRPFDDPRVRLHVEDGRRFLEDSGERYDLIVFALPDSLVRLSGMNSVRLESYLFTREAFAAARARLADDGLFVMYNQYRWEWLVDRIAATVNAEFGRQPLRMQQQETTVIAVGARLEGSAPGGADFEGLATDDWPFVYLQRPGIHWLFVGMIAMFLLTSIAAVGWLAPPGTLRRPHWGFFFMGAAFLLLETRSLALFALLFGTTWLVNALTFAGILLSVLIANLVVQSFKIRARALLFGGLFAALAVAWLMPAALLLHIDAPLLRFAAGALLVFTPIFLANLVFSREFGVVEDSTGAFGWNLLGAVAGGGLEYLSLLIGFRNLLWIVALCYLLVWFAQRAAPDAAARA